MVTVTLSNKIRHKLNDTSTEWIGRELSPTEKQVVVNLALELDQTIEEAILEWVDSQQYVACQK